MNISIHHADAIEFMRSLPDASVDAVITDPPYSAYVHRNMRGNRGEAGIVTRDPGFGHMTPWLRRAVAQEACRVARKWIAIFSDWESVTWWRISLDAAGGSYRRAIPWIRWSSPQFNAQAPPTGSEAVVIAKPRLRSERWHSGGRTHYDTKCLRANSGLEGGRKKHATEKPLQLMIDIIGDCTLPGDVVLDPFAGSGTTGVAALATGRQAILVERDAATLETMRTRIMYHQRQLELPLT